MPVKSQVFNLLWKMLPGLLPLLIFLAVDAIWGTQPGLIVAVIFGIGELIIILYREKRFDWFVIYDTALLTILGVISLISSNEIFFKLKPALINAIFLVIIGMSAFGKQNILLNYSKRYLKGVEINDDHQALMQHSFRIMFYIFLFHTLLTVYAAFFLSKAAWAFISSALLYILFGIYFGWQFLFQSRAKNMPEIEWFPVVDESGKVTGKVSRKEAHSGSRILHPVVHLHIINSKGEVYLQKRPVSKDIQPGKWDTAVGGHVNLGETIEQALQREVLEELKIREFKPTAFMNYRWDSPQESELVFSFLAQIDQPIEYNPEEISDGRFWRFSELDQLFGKNILTPNFEREYVQLKSVLFK